MNGLKSFVLIVAMTALLVWIGYAFYGELGLLAALAVSAKRDSWIIPITVAAAPLSMAAAAPRPPKPRSRPAATLR